MFSKIMSDKLWKAEHIIPWRHSENTSKHNLIPIVFSFEITLTAQVGSVHCNELAIMSTRQIWHKAVFILAFRAYLCMSKGIKAKQNVLTLVHACFYFARKGKQAKVSLKIMPFWKTPTPLPKAQRLWPPWPFISSPTLTYSTPPLFPQPIYTLPSSFQM